MRARQENGSSVRRAGNPLRGFLVGGRENRYVKGALRVVRALFVILLITFLLLLLLNNIWGLSVSPYLNLNYLLLAVIVTGAVAVLSWPDRVEVEEMGRLGRRDTILAACSGLAGGIIVWHTVKGIGWFSYFASVMIGGLVLLLSVLVMTERWPRRRGGKEDSEGN